MPAISVIVPVYKAEKYIHRCVDSILNQTFSAFELILVDDGSPDNCGVICDAYAKQDSRVRVIHQENQGQAAARNHAVAEAKAQWISFVDSDDMIHPQMLEHLYMAATENHVKISMCGAVEGEQLPDGFLDPRELLAECRRMDEDGLRLLIKQNTHRYWVVWGKLIRREIVEKIAFASGRIYEDNAIVCQWLHEAGMAADLQENYYFYQVNPEGTTKKQLTPKSLDYLWALEEQVCFYKRLGYRQMYSSMLKVYLTTSVSYYWQFEATYSCKIKEDIRRIYRSGWLFAKLNRDQRVAIYNIAFPKIHHLYEIHTAINERYRAEGVFGLYHRVLQKIKGR